jgi:deazaflavin-dependent oxidoreductase (nitroreductase family)
MTERIISAVPLIVMATKAREVESRKIKAGLLFHKISNPVVSLILRSPLHSLISGRLVLITYVGRRSGLKRTLPVQYANWDGELVVVVGYHRSKRWWLNLRNQPIHVDVRYRGRLLEGTAVAVESDADVIAPRLAEYCRKFHASARIRGIDLGSPIDFEALKAKSKDEAMVIIRPASKEAFRE